MKYEPLKSEQYHHIFNRGNNREDIFLEEKNYYYFLELLKKHIVPVAQILSYCLLRNHFHLLINTKKIEDRKISQAFSNLFNAYAKAINKQYERSGSLFKDRFSRKIIKEENQLRNLIIYIHTNPTHHGFTSDFSNYKHSSYHAFISDKETLLDREFVLNQFEDVANFKYVHQSKNLDINDDLTLE